MSAPAAASSAARPLYARASNRAVALALDLVFCVVLLVCVKALVEMVGGIRQGIAGTTAVIAAYFIASTASKWQGTPGKHLMGIKVMGLAGERMGLRRATLRWAAFLLSIATLGLGFGVSFWNARRRTLHDFLAGTVVVQQAATAEQIASTVPQAPKLGTSVLRTALLAAILGMPVFIYESVLHGSEARRINAVNFERAAPVVAALAAYKKTTGRYPKSLEDLQPQYISALPKLEISSVSYQASENADQCWLAIVYWLRAGFMPSDDGNEYDCESRTWRVVDFNELKALPTNPSGNR